MIFRLKALVSLVALLVCCVSLAAPITPDGAFRAAENWRGGARRHLGKPAGAPTGRMRTFSEDGTNLFHLVELDGGGFVAVAADDSRPPVMAFSPSGELPEEDDGGPFWTMLAADGAAAIDAAAGKGDRGGKSHRRKHHSRRRLSMREHQASPAARAAGKVQRSTASSKLSSISDVRVAPLVESKWDQMSAGGKYTYNYHTTNHWYCGCVATAMAQLMRFHKFPTASVTPQTFTCYISSTNNPVSLTMIGGTYDWNLMPYVPDASTSDAEREMIGRLCYDAGVSVRMQYGSGGSGAFAPFVHDPLVKVFGYANAESHIMDWPLVTNDLENAILTNLDAGYPVLLGIGDPGHAILADGYGYEDNTLWCHVNMGWGGQYDLWYALPYIPAGSYNFNFLDSITYNVFPTGTGQLVTGRVTDQNGNPIEGAKVSATSTSGMSSFLTNVTTSVTGIYSVRIPMSSRKSRSVTLTASYGQDSSDTKSITIKKSVSPYGMDWRAGVYYPSTGTVIGNSWGNNLTITIRAEEPSPVTVFYIQ